MNNPLLQQQKARDLIVHVQSDVQAVLDDIDWNVEGGHISPDNINPAYLNSAIRRLTELREALK